MELSPGAPPEPGTLPPEPSAAEPGTLLCAAEPGTLLWVGPTGHREFIDAYRFCRDQTAQIAVRASVSAAIRRPAGYVYRVIFARATRQTPRPASWARFAARYGRASMIALCSSLCDGEGRTGKPWPVDAALRFSRWDELLPTWLSPCGVRAAVAKPGRSLLVISDRFEMAEPYLHWASGLGMVANWQRRFIPALHRSFDTVLWDDSSAQPAAPAAWRARLGTPACNRGECPADPRGASPRHLWLALQPSIDAIDHACDGGISRVLTKPVRTESILDAIRHR